MKFQEQFLVHINGILTTSPTSVYFICFSQKFSELRATEISVVRPHYSNFCDPHYRRFLGKAYEINYLLRKPYLYNDSKSTYYIGVKNQFALMIHFSSNITPKPRWNILPVVLTLIFLWNYFCYYKSSNCCWWEDTMYLRGFQIDDFVLQIAQTL